MSRAMKFDMMNYCVENIHLKRHTSDIKCVDADWLIQQIYSGVNKGSTPARRYQQALLQPSNFLILSDNPNFPLVPAFCYITCCCRLLV
jgi:hypothetical protein